MERGQAIRAARERAQLQQADVAAALKVKQAAVSKWETGRALPEAGKLVRLAVLLKCSVEDLVVGVEPSYDRLRSKRRDLPDHADRGSSSAAHSQPQQGARDETAAAQDRVLKELANAHDTFVRAVSDVANRLARIVENEKAHGALGAPGKNKADGVRSSRKVG